MSPLCQVSRTRSRGTKSPENPGADWATQSRGPHGEKILPTLRCAMLLWSHTRMTRSASTSALAHSLSSMSSGFCICFLEADLKRLLRHDVTFRRILLNQQSYSVSEFRTPRASSCLCVPKWATLLARSLSLGLGLCDAIAMPSLHHKQYLLLKTISRAIFVATLSH